MVLATLCAVWPLASCKAQTSVFCSVTANCTYTGNQTFQGTVTFTNTVTLGDTVTIGPDGSLVINGGSPLTTTNQSGTGSLCMTISCVMTTPNLGTPSAVTLTNGIGLPFSGLTTGTLAAGTLTVGTGGVLTFSGTGTVNASTLLGNTWAVPGCIGCTTPSTGAFTSLYTTGTVTGLIEDSGGQVFNIKSYGAYGDGVHNDTLAFNAADTAAQVTGGIIYFPPGTYELDNPQQVNPSNVTSGHNYVSIQCAGASNTVIQFTGSIGFILGNLFQAAPYYGVDVSGCTFDLTKASSGTIALHLIDSVGFMIHNNGFIGTATNNDVGIELENSTAWNERNQILHNQFYELNPGIELLEDTTDSSNSFGFNIIAEDHFQIPSGGTGILLTSPSNYTAKFGLYNARIDARANFDTSATAGSVVSCINGAEIYQTPIYIGAEGTSGTYDVSADANSSIAGVGMILAFGGGTVPTSGSTIYNTLIAGAYYQLIESGSSAPTGACNTGSLFLNSAGISGSTLYACVAGAWSDVK